MTWSKVLISSLLLMFFCQGTAWSAEELLQFDNEQQRQRYLQLTFELRCPKCQNQNVADSNAPIAEDIRTRTYQLIREGYSDQEIIDFMVERYTEFVIYKPQLSFITVWLWLLPLALLVLGSILVVRLSVRGKQTPQTDFSAAEQARLDELLSKPVLEERD
ncbi:cytochrome c-type biogenesis protein [Reinekea thalattae]|nr:cytochrome c-type biogenesis protein [Reinekea thalattae]